jgi:hypothetical protein
MAWFKLPPPLDPQNVDVLEFWSHLHRVNAGEDCGIFAQSKNCGTRETAVARQYIFSKYKRPLLGDAFATIKELFSTCSMPRGYKRDTV